MYLAEDSPCEVDFEKASWHLVVKIEYSSPKPIPYYEESELHFTSTCCNFSEGQLSQKVSFRQSKHTSLPMTKMKTLTCMT